LFRTYDEGGRLFSVEFFSGHFQLKHPNPA